MTADPPSHCESWAETECCGTSYCRMAVQEDGGDSKPGVLLCWECGGLVADLGDVREQYPEVQEAE